MKKFIIPPRLHLKMKKDMKNFQSSAELETAPQKSYYANGKDELVKNVEAMEELENIGKEIL